VNRRGNDITGAGRIAGLAIRDGVRYEGQLGARRAHQGWAKRPSGEREVMLGAEFHEHSPSCVTKGGCSEQKILRTYMNSYGAQSKRGGFISMKGRNQLGEKESFNCLRDSSSEEGLCRGRGDDQSGGFFLFLLGGRRNLKSLWGNLTDLIERNPISWGGGV